MENNILNKEVIEAETKKMLGEAFAGFAAKADSPRSCSVGVYEKLPDSGWAGKWTEQIRRIVRESSPAVECACVKPLQFGAIAWYRINVA